MEDYTEAEADCLEEVLTSQDQATQVDSLLPRIPYQNYEYRKKSEIRASIFENIFSMLQTYVDHDEEALNLLISDLMSSRKWKQTFGSHGMAVEKNHEKDDTFLQALAREYKACKERENNITISKKGKQLKQPIKISGSKHGSCIEFEGTTPQDSKSRTDAARTMGRINTFAAEKRRLLSIVANDYSQTFLTKLFQCSKSTVTAARVHCIMFGRGVPPASLTFTRQCVTQEVLDGLADFLLRDNVSRPSSCRSVVIDGEECPVRYWQDSIKGLIQQYLLEFPDGVKRTFIYSHVPLNYRSNSLLAGLCNLCEDYGYSNFDSLKAMVEEMRSNTMVQGLDDVQHKIRDLQRYIKTKFAKEVNVFLFIIVLFKCTMYTARRFHRGYPFCKYFSLPLLKSFCTVYCMVLCTYRYVEIDEQHVSVRVIINF